MAFDITKMVEKNATVEKTNIEDKFKIVDISIDKIIVNEKNFYNTDEIEDIKATILILGLEQNLVVAPKDENGMYKLIAGHRRFKAIRELINEEKLSIKVVPCKINNKPDILKRLSLIVTNATAREVSPAEKMKQIEELKAIGNELKKDKEYDFTGSVREFIASFLKISETEVARYNAISNNLDDEIKEEFKNDQISTDTAYAISRLQPEQQEEALELIKEAKEENKKITTKDVKTITQKENNIDESLGDVKDWTFENQMSVDDKENIGSDEGTKTINDDISQENTVSEKEILINSTIEKYKKRLENFSGRPNYDEENKLIIEALEVYKEQILSQTK